MAETGDVSLAANGGRDEFQTNYKRAGSCIILNIKEKPLLISEITGTKGARHQ